MVYMYAYTMDLYVRLFVKFMVFYINPGMVLTQTRYMYINMAYVYSCAMDPYVRVSINSWYSMSILGRS